MNPNAQEIPIPENQRIEILIKNLDHRQVQGMLIDSFGPTSSPTKPIFVIFDASWKPKDKSSVFVTYKNFRIVEDSKNPKIDHDELAQIIMQQYPHHTIFFIEMTSKDKNDWEKVTSITQEILSRMELLDYEIESVKPRELSPESLHHPWERVPDRGPNREILKMWWEGYTNSEIARKVSLQPRTITNIISRLRIEHGDETVPRDDQRRKSYIKNDDIA